MGVGYTVVSFVYGIVRCLDVLLLTNVLMLIKSIGCENTKFKTELRTCNEITARLNFDALDQLCSQTYSSPSTLCKSRMQALFISMGIFYKQQFGMYHHLIIVRRSTTSPLPDITQPTHHPSPLSSPY